MDEKAKNNVIIQKELSKLKRQCVKIKQTHIKDVKELLKCFGLKYIIAEGEADKLCAELVIHNKAYACMSDDMDLFMYGCPRVFRLFNIQNTHFAAMICVESTFPYLSSNFVKRGAQVLVYVVNVGWYESPPEPQQHAKQAVYRASENRKPVLRCTNTGISMVISPSGNITKELPLNQSGVISAAIIPNNELTFYTRYGDVIAQLSAVISICFIIGVLIRKK